MSSLGEYLAGQGFTVDDNPVYGRTTTWRGVKWLMVHHYAGSEMASAAAGEARRAKEGFSAAPICQLYLDLTGKVWVISKERPGQESPGRASHAGTGSYPGIEDNKGNEVALGIECQCSGQHPLSTHSVEYEALIRLLAVLCRRYGLDASKVIGHKEYTSRKVDPRDDMDVIRRDVAAELAATEKPKPPKPKPPVSKWAGGDVYLSKLRYGQRDSDSVRRLQYVLNGHQKAGLPITGNYFDQTDAEVREDQARHVPRADPPRRSYVGRRQADHLFGPTYRVIP
jgi:hypothetical protein